MQNTAQNTRVYVIHLSVRGGFLTGKPFSGKLPEKLGRCQSAWSQPRSCGECPGVHTHQPPMTTRNAALLQSRLMFQSSFLMNR